MNTTNPVNAHAKIVFALCLLVLVCILVAGLWPFHTPHNAVSWLKNGNGLRFGRHGSVLSASAFRDTGSSGSAGYSLEIWLTPARVPGSGSILTFDSSPDPWAPFLLRQYGTGVAIHRYSIDEHGNITQPFFKVNRVFVAGQRVLVSLTSNKDHTELYVNGVLAGASSDPGIASRELTGRLVLANSTIDDSWAGQIDGLAIYDRELTPAQVNDHLQSWRADRGAVLAGEQSPIALYLFDERGGSTVHNLIDPATNLTIPARYFVLHPGFLRSTWNQFSHTRNAWEHWGFWQDMGVNVGGFVPVGFVFFAYFSSVKPTKRAALVVILMGFFLSFTVEALQRLLPNRDSGMTDLFTNTTGTALGVLLHRSSIVRALWTRALNFGVPAFRSPVAAPVVGNQCACAGREN